MAHAFLASPACPALGPSRLTAPRHRRVPSKPSRLITRAKAADDVEDEDAKAFMGRRGTRREDVEDDAATAEARSSVKQQGGFGKPVTAKETWQPFQRTARAGLLEAADGERTGSPDHRDLVRTSLYISMEDDAFKSRTAVCLPIAAYVKRVDKLTDEFEEPIEHTLRSSSFLNVLDQFSKYQLIALFEPFCLKKAKGHCLCIAWCEEA